MYNEQAPPHQEVRDTLRYMAFFRNSLLVLAAVCSGAGCVEKNERPGYIRQNPIHMVYPTSREEDFVPVFSGAGKAVFNAKGLVIEYKGPAEQVISECFPKRGKKQRIVQIGYGKEFIDLDPNCRVEITSQPTPPE